MTDGTTSLSFTYNADSQRVSKTVGGVTYNYVYVGSTLTDMTWGNNAMHFVYDALGAAAVVYNGTTYYYLRNAQGDITGLIDSNGTQVVGYTYDTWGKLLSTTGTMAATLGADNPLRYRGYVYDEETGLYYLTSRYYNPAWDRFINADGYVSTGQGFVGNNMFVYCNNNPVMLTDSDGDMSFPSVISTLILAYTATKCLLSAAGDLYLRANKLPAARATYEHGMWGNRTDLPQKKKDTITKQLKEPPRCHMTLRDEEAQYHDKKSKSSSGDHRRRSASPRMRRLCLGADISPHSERV